MTRTEALQREVDDLTSYKAVLQTMLDRWIADGGDREGHRQGWLEGRIASHGDFINTLEQILTISE